MSSDEKLISSSRVAEAISRITSHTDRDLFDSGFAELLLDLLNIDQIKLYKVLYEYNQPEYYCMLDFSNDKRVVYGADQSPPKVHDKQRIAAFDDCLTGKCTTFTSIKQNDTAMLYPVFNYLDQITSIFCVRNFETAPDNDQPLISSLFTIYRNHLHLIDKTEHDTLTGLLNRRTFDRDLCKILTQSHQVSDPSLLTNNNKPRRRRNSSDKKGNWLAVIDIDFFKHINDKYGHLYGDEVLLLLSNIMRKTFRTYDKMFRFGGEEFVVILRTTNQTDARLILERFRKNIEEFAFPQVGNVTVSIGYVEITNQAIPAEILGHADNALYYAKKHGRNQLANFEKLVTEGKISPAKAITPSEVELF